jgi:hypothetical protein
VGLRLRPGLRFWRHCVCTGEVSWVGVLGFVGRALRGRGFIYIAIERFLGLEL